MDGGLMKVGIIGYGSMGRMLLEKFVESGVAPDSVLVSNRTPEKLADIGGAAVVCGSNAETASRADVLFLCVRPADLRTVLEEIREALREETLIVSLNGSVTFEQLGRIVRHRMAKAIPGVTAEINKSQTLVCYNELAETENREAMKRLFSAVGDVIELPENEMGMGSELVSCMPGFIASVFDVLCRAAEKHTDIPRDRVIRMVLKTMCATGELMLAKQMSFEDVVARVATKGGITEEGTKVIYGQFPETADRLFENTLEKRRLTAERAEAYFQ